MKRITAIPCALLLLGQLFCATHHNPFADSTHARVHVIGKVPPSTLPIFHTETLTVVAAVRELVDSFKVEIHGNRLGPDTTVRREGARLIPARAFSFTYSFQDTGDKIIALHTFRSRQEIVTERFTVRVSSPLHQDTVYGNLGESVRLSTSGVKDPDAWYHWCFGPGEIGPYTTISSALNHLDTLVSDVDPGGSGVLWVSDIRNRYRSSPVPFRFVLRDTRPPVITIDPRHPVRSGPYGDTVVTGETSLRLRLRITDPGSGAVHNPALNGRPLFAEGNSIYSLEFSGLDESAVRQPLLLEAFAADPSGNTTRESFFLLYDPLLPIEPLALDILAPAETHTRTRQDTISVVASVQRTGAQQIVLRLIVNGHHRPDTAVVDGQGVHGWSVALEKDENDVLVHAAKPGLDPIAAVQRVVVLDRTMPDTLPPVIAEVFLLDSGGNQTAQSIARLRIIAFDEGVGIESLTVNNMRHAPSEGNHQWSASVPLIRGAAGNPVVIRAVDRRGNVSAPRRITIYRNTSPLILKPLTPPTPLWVGSTWIDTLKIVDPDGDSVRTRGINLPKGCVLQGSTILWTPQDGDTGRHEILIEFDDGYPAVKTYRCTVDVAIPINRPCSLSYRAAHGSIRNDTLFLSDSLRPDTLHFTIHDPDLAFTEKYRVSLDINGRIELRTQDTVRGFTAVVDPAGLDGGGGYIRVVVEDRGGHRDSVVLRIVPARAESDVSVLRRIRINTTAANGGAALNGLITNFPLPLRLDQTNFRFSSLPTDGGFLIRRVSGRELPYEIEQWNPAGQSAGLWVLVDTVRGNDSTQFLELCWDSNRNGHRSSPEQVFDTSRGYRMVYHLDSSATGRGSTRVYRNSARDAHHGTDYISVSAVPGIVGRAAALARGDYIDLGTPEISGSQLMISAWVRPNVGANEQTIVGKADALLGQRWSLRLEESSPTGPRFLVRTNGSLGSLSGRQTMPTTGVWSYVAALYDGQTMRVYSYNSAQSGLMGMTTQTGAIDPGATIRAFIGATPGTEGLGSFVGLIDEVRIESVARSEEWIRFCYETQKPGGRAVLIEVPPGGN